MAFRIISLDVARSDYVISSKNQVWQIVEALGRNGDYAADVT